MVRQAFYILCSAAYGCIEVFREVNMGRKQKWKSGNMLYPVPAVMLSCGRADEKPNIITVAWAGTVCSDPVMVSVSLRPQRYSYGIIKETGEFVLNLTNEKLVRAADLCGVRSGRDIDKFKACGLDARAAFCLKDAPVISQSPLSLECRVREIIPLGSHDMFLSEVVCVDADERYLDENGRFDFDAARLIAYSHGAYMSLGETLGSFGFSVRKKIRN